MMNRRGFLGAMLAAAAAPAIVRASSLMPVAPRIWTPELGTWNGVRIISGPLGQRSITEYQECVRDVVRYGAGVLTVSTIRRAVDGLESGRRDSPERGYVVLVPPDFAQSLRSLQHVQVRRWRR